MSTNSGDRRSIRLPEYDYAQRGGYFVTICSHEHKCLFGNIENSVACLSDVGRIVDREWRRTSEIRAEIELDAFVIMPNHLHAILFVTRETVLGALPGRCGGPVIGR